jgi:hypothetical protein
VAGPRRGSPRCRGAAEPLAGLADWDPALLNARCLAKQVPGRQVAICSPDAIECTEDETGRRRSEPVDRGVTTTAAGAAAGGGQLSVVGS